MLKVELVSDGRFHSADGEGLRRKLAESRSLMQQKSERDVVSDWRVEVRRIRELVIGLEDRCYLQWGLR